VLIACVALLTPSLRAEEESKPKIEVVSAEDIEKEFDANEDTEALTSE
jgi:hypothetical protein